MNDTDYMAGYEFALRNLHDEAVQADLDRLTAAGISVDEVNSDHLRGAADALDESKGQGPILDAPALAGVFEMFEHLSEQARLALAKHGPRRKSSLTRCAICAATVELPHYLLHLRWHRHIEACLDIASDRTCMPGWPPVSADV